MSNDIFEQATRSKMRVQTIKGNLSVEQLWDLPVNVLDSIYGDLDDLKDKSSKKSLLKEKSSADTELDLQLAVIKYIVEVKVTEQEAARTATEKKQHNQRILQLIQQKKNEELAGKSVEELEKMLQ